MQTVGIIRPVVLIFYNPIQKETDYAFVESGVLVSRDLVWIVELDEDDLQSRGGGFTLSNHGRLHH